MCAVLIKCNDNVVELLVEQRYDKQTTIKEDAMMKRLLSLSLSLLMLLSLAVPTALAAETKPAPPAWVKAEEYAVFEGDSTYTGETWETVLRLRNDAAAGNLEPQSGDLYTD